MVPRLPKSRLSPLVSAAAMLRLSVPVPPSTESMSVSAATSVTAKAVFEPPPAIAPEDAEVMETVTVGVVLDVVVVVDVLELSSSLAARISRPTSSAAPATATATTVVFRPGPLTTVTSSLETMISLPSMMYWPSLAMNRWPFSSSNSIWPLPSRSKLTTEEVISSKPSTLSACACAAAMTLAPAAATAAAVILPRLLRLISASLLAIRSATDFMSLNSIKFSAPKYSRDTRNDPERSKRPGVFFNWSNTSPEITGPLRLS